MFAHVWVRRIWEPSSRVRVLWCACNLPYCYGDWIRWRIACIGSGRDWPGLVTAVSPWISKALWSPWNGTPLDRETLTVHHFVMLATNRVKESTGGGLARVHSALNTSVEVFILQVNDSQPLLPEPWPLASKREDGTRHPGTMRHASNGLWECNRTLFTSNPHLHFSFSDLGSVLIKSLLQPLMSACKWT